MGNPNQAATQVTFLSSEFTGKDRNSIQLSEKKPMDSITILGLVAALFTTVSLFPQLFRMVKTKSTKDISTGMFTLFSGGVLLWFIYGLFIHDWPVIIANSVAFVVAVSILCLKLKYR